LLEPSLHRRRHTILEMSRVEFSDFSFVAELPASAVIELRLNELLCHEQMKHPKLAISLAEGWDVDISRAVKVTH